MPETKTGAVLIRGINPVRMFDSFAAGVKYLRDVYEVEPNVMGESPWQSGFAEKMTDRDPVTLRLLEMPIMPEPRA